MSRFRILDHPADLLIEFTAPSKPAVYELAAKILFELQYESEPGCPQVVSTREHLRATDPEELLVSWLNRLLFIHETRQLRLGDIEILFLSDKELIADAAWFKVGLEAEQPVQEIKMATYHELELKQSGSNWYVKILFDL